MSSPLKLAIVAACPFPAQRGTPARIRHMATALAERGHEIHVVTYHLGDELEGAPFQVHRIAELPSYRRTAPGPSYQKLALIDSLLALKLAEVLRRNAIDMVHAHHYEGLIVSALAQHLAPHLAIYDAHTLLASELPYYRLGLPRRLLRLAGGWLDRALPRRAHHVIAITEEIRHMLVAEAGVPAERVSVVPNGVEWEHFAPAAMEPPSRTPTLVYAGNLAAYQGIELLLDALARVLAVRPEVRLRIASASSFAPYAALAERLGVSHALEFASGRLADLPRHLAGANVAVNPRIDCDGAPLKLLNYMAAGRAIVSFAGSAKYLEHGRTALVVPNGDTAGLAATILRLLNDSALAGQIGAAAREYVRTTCVWERRAEQLEQIYAGLYERAGVLRKGAPWALS